MGCGIMICITLSGAEHLIHEKCRLLCRQALLFSILEIFGWTSAFILIQINLMQIESMLFDDSECPFILDIFLVIHNYSEDSK